MATATLLPVYPAEEVAELFRLRISRSVLEQFKTPPETSERRVIVWHPGLSLMEQAALPLVSEQKCLWIRPELRTHKLAIAPVQASYYSVCLPAPHTAFLSVNAQEAVVAPFGETACPAAVATWTWLVHFLKTGESLGLGFWLRCAEESSFGIRVELLAYANKLFVGGFGDRGAIGRIRLASLGLPGEGNLAS